MAGEKSYIISEEDEGKSCSRRPTALRKLIFFLLLVVVALVVALIVVAVKDDDNDDGGSSSDNGLAYCTTPDCVEASATILRKMNLSVDPCEDMYHYACGGWLDKVVPPSYSPKWTIFAEMSDSARDIMKQLIEEDGAMFKGKNSTAIAKMKTFYQTCMDEDTIEQQGTEPILKLMDKLGSWTVTSAGLTQWDKDNWQLQTSVQDMHKLLRSSLFSIEVGTDVKDISRNIIQFSQNGLTLAHEHMYQKENFQTAYMGFAVKVGELLGGDTAVVREKMAQVFQLEKSISEIFIPRENLTNPLVKYNKMTIDQFQGLIGTWIDLKEYLSAQFEGKVFSKDEEVIVTVPKYYEKLGEIVQNTDKEILANYLMWNMLQSITGYLPPAFSKAALILMKAENGVTSLQERWKRCIGKTEDVIGFAISALYVDGQFSSDSKVKITAALDGIRDQFIKNLDSVSWLDDKTRGLLKEKAEATGYKVGYPDWILNTNKLDERYEKLRIVEGEFLTDLLNAIEYIQHRDVIEKYGRPPDDTEWNDIPVVVNAYNEVSPNKVMLPAAILQPPFYAPHYPLSYVYGGIGTVVGHELTHGFDSAGRMYDKNGKLKNMWTDAAAKEFEKRTQCMIDQYSSYTLQGQNLNGKLTLGENIADNGGVKFAFYGYKAVSKPTEPNLPGLNLSHDQMFFLGFSQIWCSYYQPEYELTSIETDVHSNARYRVIGTLSNSKEFSKAFNCDINSALNPEEKCQVW